MQFKAGYDREMPKGISALVGHTLLRCVKDRATLEVSHYWKEKR